MGDILTCTPLQSTLTVPRPPVRLYLACERAIPLACVPTLHLVDGLPDCPLGI